MRIEFDYLALIRARPPRCRSERLAVISMSTSGHLSEVSSSEAPIACRLSDGNWDTYRYMDGRFFALAGDATDFDGQGGFVTSLMRDLMSKREDFPGVDVWPPRAKERFGLLIHTPRFIKNLENHHKDFHRQGAVGEVADLNWISDEDVSSWRDAAEKLIRNTFVCDGSIWTQMPEPLIAISEPHVHHIPSRLLRHDVSLYDRDNNRYRATISADSMMAVYPLCDMDGAIERIGEVPGDKENEIAELEGMKIHMPEVFGDGFAQLEMERLHRFAYRSLRHATALSRDNRDPRSFVGKGLAVLSDVGLDDGIDTDVLAAALETLDDVSMPGFLRGKTSELLFKQKWIEILYDVRRVVGYWNNRDVILDLDIPLPKAPRI